MADDVAVPTPVVQLDAQKHPYVAAQRLGSPRSYRPPSVGESSLSRMNYNLFRPEDTKPLALEVVSRIVVERSISGSAPADADLVALVSDAVQFATGQGEFYALDSVYAQDGKLYGVARALRSVGGKSVKAKKESPAPMGVQPPQPVSRKEISTPEIPYVVEVGKNKWFDATVRSSPRQRIEYGRTVYDIFDPTNERVPYISPIGRQRTVTSTTIEDLLREVQKSSRELGDTPLNGAWYFYVHDVHATGHTPPKFSAKYIRVSRKR